MITEISELTENLKFLERSKAIAFGKLADPMNPPWIARACNDLLDATNTVIEMMRVPSTTVDLLESGQHQETAPR